MPFVQAKCPNCGGFLAVDNSNDAAICQFCNTPFIVEKAINNYNISVNGDLNLENANIRVEGAPNVSSLLMRARSFISAKNYARALEYFDRVLDLDPYNAEAHSGIKYLTIPPKENLIVRKIPTRAGRKGSVLVTLDGVDIASLRNGDVLRRMIPLGQHVIRFLEADSVYNFSLPSALQYAEFSIAVGKFWEVKGNICDFYRQE